MPSIGKQGWVISLLLHAAIVTLAVIGSAQIRMIDATDPFQLEVIVSEEMGPSAEATDSMAHHNGHAETDQTPAHRSIEHSTQSLSTTSFRPEPQGSPTPVQPTVQAVMERTVPQEDRDQISVRAEPTQQLMTVEGEPAVSQSVKIQHSETSSFEEAVLQESAVTHSAPMLQVQEVDATGSISSASSNSMVSSAPDGPHVEHQLTETSSRSQTTEHLEAAVSLPTTVRGENHTSNHGASSPSTSVKGTSVDYGWLKRLLWESINRVKRYSDDALDHEWEGRVIMVVTIRSDGHIQETRVARSSGNPSLDREAEELIVRASPLSLDRVLGADEVQLRVPISFGLE